MAHTHRAPACMRPGGPARQKDLAGQKYNFQPYLTIHPTIFQLHPAAFIRYFRTYAPPAMLKSASVTFFATPGANNAIALCHAEGQ